MRALCRSSFRAVADAPPQYSLWYFRSNDPSESALTDYLVQIVTLSFAFMQLAILRIVQKNSLGYLAATVQNDAGRYFATRVRKLSAWVCMTLAVSLFALIYIVIIFVEADNPSMNISVITGIGFFFCAVHLGEFLTLVFSSCLVLIHELHMLRRQIVNHRIQHGEAAKRYAKLRLALTQLSDDLSVGTVPFMIGAALYVSTGMIETFFAAQAGIAITASSLVSFLSASVFANVILLPLAAVTMFSERCRSGAQRAAGLEAGVKRMAGAAADNSTQLFITYFDAVAGEKMRVGPWDISFSLLVRIVYLILAAIVSIYAAVSSTAD